MDKKVNVEDFFNFNSQTPVKRIAYTEEDLKYKIKFIQKMQELGMDITMDKACNICGTLAIGEKPKRILAIGSHTDSVNGGGQYDGPTRCVCRFRCG